MQRAVEGKLCQGKGGGDGKRQDAPERCRVCKRNGAKYCTSHRMKSGKAGTSDKDGFVAAAKG